MFDTFARLAQSRKFIAALLAAIHTVVSYYYDVPQEVWGAIDLLAAAYIGSVAIEDGAEKSVQWPAE